MREVLEHETDDPFAHTRMPITEHIEELRSHMWRALWGFAVALGLSLFFGDVLVQFIARPVEEQLVKFYDRRIEQLEKALRTGDPKLAEMNEPAPVELLVDRQELRSALGLKSEAATPEGPVTLRARIPPASWAIVLAKPLRQLVRPPLLGTLTVTEAFMIYFKVCICAAIVLSSPWLFYQAWSFVAVGLYPHERRNVNLYLPFSLGLFLAGVLLCEFVVIPKAVEYLLSFNAWLDLEPNLRLSDWLSFAVLMPLVFGAAFQTPLAMLFVNRLGILTVADLRSKRRYAAFFLAILAAVLTPTPDLISMLALAIPLWGLYELGIVLCRYAPGPAEEVDELDSVEV